MGNTNATPSPPPAANNAPPAGKPKAVPIQPPKKEGKDETFDGFDPTGLERAAAAARELQSLDYASEAIEISKAQELTKQKEMELKSEENRTKQKAFAAEAVRIQEEERRRSIEAEKQAKQQQAYYQDQLARKRNQDQMQQERAVREEDVKRQEESQMRIEALRRQTAEYEANLRKEAEKTRAEAEARGRIEQERTNWDLHMQRSKMESLEYRTTVLQGVKEAGTMVGQGLKDYITDYEKLANTALVFTAIALGVYTAKNVTGVVGRIVEARFAKPPLVRETSRLRLADMVRSPISSTLKKLPFQKKTDALAGTVFGSTLKERLSNLAISSANTQKNKSPYRHMMLYGPPGTGKTMFAKNLAEASGMDYAIMTGGDVAPLGRDAVTEIHKLFDWSSTSSKGLLLFVDEADAFLRKRTNENLSEDTRNALNAFLYRTGEASKKFQVVFASNQPDQLDWAVTDRVDELVHFDLPEVAEREEMIKLYFNTFVVDSHKQSGFSIMGGPKEITVSGVDDALFQSMAKKAQGFSGREISKLAIAWQAAARGTADCAIDGKQMMEILEDRIAQHEQKNKWEEDRV